LIVTVDVKLHGFSTGSGDVEKAAPSAMSRAINRVAFDVQRAERDAIETTFWNPRPFTARSVLVNQAKPNTLTALVFVRPEVARYLAPYETGGLHWLPGRGLTWLQPAQIGTDPYGQLRHGTTARLKARPNVFVGAVQTRSGEVRGFWQRLKTWTGQRVKLLIRFADNREVDPKLGFVERGTALVQAGFQREFDREMARLLEG
jgi:hypothetical protein